MLRLARERVELPQGKLWLDYQPDVDLLCVRLVERPHATHSDSDLDRGIIYNYEGRKLVSIEILDLYGVFVK